MPSCLEALDRLAEPVGERQGRGAGGAREERGELVAAARGRRARRCRAAPAPRRRRAAAAGRPPPCRAAALTRRRPSTSSSSTENGVPVLDPGPHQTVELLLELGLAGSPVTASRPSCSSRSSSSACVNSALSSPKSRRAARERSRSSASSPARRFGRSRPRAAPAAPRGRAEPRRRRLRARAAAISARAHAAAEERRAGRARRAGEFELVEQVGDERRRLPAEPAERDPAQSPSGVRSTIPTTQAWASSSPSARAMHAALAPPSSRLAKLEQRAGRHSRRAVKYAALRWRSGRASR